MFYGEKVMIMHFPDILRFMRKLGKLMENLKTLKDVYITLEIFMRKPKKLRKNLKLLKDMYILLKGHKRYVDKILANPGINDAQIQEAIEEIRAKIQIFFEGDDSFKRTLRIIDKKSRISLSASLLYLMSPPPRYRDVLFLLRYRSYLDKCVRITKGSYKKKRNWLQTSIAITIIISILSFRNPIVFAQLYSFFSREETTSALDMSRNEKPDGRPNIVLEFPDTITEDDIKEFYLFPLLETKISYDFKENNMIFYWISTEDDFMHEFSIKANVTDDFYYSQIDVKYYADAKNTFSYHIIKQIPKDLIMSQVKKDLVINYETNNKTQKDFRSLQSILQQARALVSLNGYVEYLNSNMTEPSKKDIDFCRSYLNIISKNHEFYKIQPTLQDERIRDWLSSAAANEKRVREAIYLFDRIPVRDMLFAWKNFEQLKMKNIQKIRFYAMSERYIADTWGNSIENMPFIFSNFFGNGEIRGNPIFMYKEMADVLVSFIRSPDMKASEKIVAMNEAVYPSFETIEDFFAHLVYMHNMARNYYDVVNDNRLGEKSQILDENLDIIRKFLQIE
jgi:hypothetical protein